MLQPFKQLTITSFYSIRTLKNVFYNFLDKSNLSITLYNHSPTIQLTSSKTGRLLLLPRISQFCFLANVSS